MNDVNVLLRILGDPDDAQRALRTVAREMLALAKQRAKATVDVATSRARAEIAAVKAALAGIDNKHVEIRVDRDGGVQMLTGAGTTATRVLNGLGEATSRLGDFFGGLSDVTTRARLDLGLLTIGGKAIGPILVLLAGLVAQLIAGIVSLGAALVAMGSSLALAIGGLGALAVALAAVGGPLAALGIGLVTRLVAGGKAAEDLEKAVEAVKQATEAYADAERNLTQAKEDATRAERELTGARREARQEAAERMRQALDQLAQAERNVETTQRSVIGAQQALTAAREDATRALEDMRRAADNSETSEKAARVALTKSRNELERMEAAGENGARIRDQRIAVEQAENALKDARVAGRRSAEDLAKAEKDGVNGSSQVVSAQQAIADANYSAAKAVEELASAQQEVADAQRVDIKRSAGVVSARRGLASANEQVEDAERGLADAARDLTEAQDEATEASKRAATYGAGAVSALKEAASGLNAAFQGMISGAAQQVFGSLFVAMQRLRTLMASLAPAFTQLGAAIGASIEQWATALSGSGWQRFFQTVTRAATEIVPLLSSVFLYLAEVLRNIAEATLPLLVQGFRGISKWLDGLSAGTANVGALRETIAGLVSHLRTWLGLMGAVIDAIVALFTAVGPAGQEFVQWLTEAIAKWGEWASSEEGRKRIQQFFARVLPLAKDLLSTFLEIVNAVLALTEALAPVMTWLLENVVDPLIDRLTTFLGFIADVANALSDLKNILGDAWDQAWGAMAPPVIGGGPFGGITDALDGLKGELGINSPSKVMAEMGRDVGRGFAIGIGQSLSDVAAASSSMGATPALAASAAGRSAAARGGDFVQNNHFSTPSGGPADPEAAAAQISRRLRARGLTFA